MSGQHWRDGRLTSFDLETTGVQVAVDRVVTGTILGIGGGQEKVVRNWLVNPGIPIPEGAANIHKVTTEIAQRDGVEPAGALNAIRDELVAAWDRGEPVVVYNAPYDFTLLDCELARHGLIRLPRPLGPVIDPLTIDKFNDPFRRGSRKLIDTCRHYGIVLSDADAHTSEGDTLAAARLAYAVASPSAGVSVRTGWGKQTAFDKRRGRVHAMSLGELQAAQAAWSEEQRLSFAEYKAKRGEHAVAAEILSETGWPIRKVDVVEALNPPPF